MKRLLVVVVALAATGSLAAAEDAESKRTLRVAICHKTNSVSRPYQRIVVTTASARAAHVRHPDDIIPAPRRCPQTLLRPTSGGTAISVALVGASEQPDVGDPDGTGTASIRVRVGQGRLCYTMDVRDVALPAAGAHIHHGSAEEAGPIVVSLGAPGASGSASGCVAVGRPLVRDLLQNRTSYYVNVHTTDFPAGALRAQLARPSTAPLLTASMNGPNERPTAGDADGTGTAVFALYPARGRLCYTLAVRNIIMPTAAAHIHRGGADVAGGVLIPLTAPNANGVASACINADPAVLTEIVANPAGFYANVHTRDFPGGAVRGQLTS
jgi:hypothetical protein